MAPRVLYPDGSVPSVCIIGAGVGGLCAAIQLKRKLGLASFTVFDRAHDIGGVWLANKYPGCQVDTPGAVYSYSFEPNPGN
jgi:cation diffusion facilitator CzcD-associated flavoprotein CzcO